VNTDRVPTILFAEDDPDDRLLLIKAIETRSSACDLRFVEDGDELMEYLHRRGRYADEADAPRPALILLDLNMPGKDGRVAAREIKGDARLRQIPLLVLTTSKSQEDVFQAYDAGVNSFLRKPLTFDGLLALVDEVRSFWLSSVELPAARTDTSRRPAQTA